MKQSDELLAKRKRLEQKEEALFDEYQDFKQFTEASENLLFEIQHLQSPLEAHFFGSRQMHSIDSLYTENLSQSKHLFSDITQMEKELKRERYRCEEEIDNIQRTYYQALQKEETEQQRGATKW